MVENEALLFASLSLPSDSIQFCEWKDVFFNSAFLSFHRRKKKFVCIEQVKWIGEIWISVCSERDTRSDQSSAVAYKKLTRSSCLHRMTFVFYCFFYCFTLRTIVALVYIVETDIVSSYSACFRSASVFLMFSLPFTYFHDSTPFLKLFRKRMNKSRKNKNTHAH